MKNILSWWPVVAVLCLVFWVGFLVGRKTFPVAEQVVYHSISLDKKLCNEKGGQFTVQQGMFVEYNAPIVMKCTKSTPDTTIFSETIAP